MEAGGSKHPYVSVRPWVRRTPGEPDVPGLGVFRLARMVIHLTHDEARTLADQLHDSVDQVDKEAP